LVASECVGAYHHAEHCQWSFDYRQPITQIVEGVADRKLVDFAMVQQQFAVRAKKYCRIENIFVTGFNEAGTDVNVVLFGPVSEAAARIAFGDRFRRYTRGRMCPTQGKGFRKQNHLCSVSGRLGDACFGTREILVL
jgi:hypothetical protein